MDFNFVKFTKKRNKKFYDLQSDLKTVAGQLGNFVCVICGSEFTSYTQFKRHFKKMHRYFPTHYHRIKKLPRRKREEAEEKLNDIIGIQKKRSSLKTLSILIKLNRTIVKKINKLKKQLQLEKENDDEIDIKGKRLTLYQDSLALLKKYQNIK